MQIIKIGPMTYTVATVESLQNANGTELLGEICYHKATIKLDAEMHPQARRITLLHEIIHGILNNAGFQRHSEALIDAISSGIIAVVDDNPDVLAAQAAAPQE